MFELSRIEHFYEFLGCPYHDKESTSATFMVKVCTEPHPGAQHDKCSETFFCVLCM